ncbi:MAG: YncE family protein [Planctomycetes bacterium]|nr:YncE family protein [Planctomycetota bacterium]MCB9887937.1 YncE family protein [Planctomycetota bacterium]
MSRTAWAACLALVAGVQGQVADSKPVGAAAEPRRAYSVLVCAESSDEVYKLRFDGAQVAVEKVIPVGYQATEIEGPHGITVAPDGKHWFLSMAHGKPFGLLYRFRSSDDRVTGRVQLGLFPATMQISRATGLLYCVNFDLHGDMTPSSVSIVDPVEMAEVGRTRTGSMPHGSRLSPDGKRHYSCSMMDGFLHEIDAVSFERTRRLPLGDGTGAAKSAHGGGDGADDRCRPTWVQPHPRLTRAYVCLNGIAQLAEVDLAGWKVTRRWPTGKGPYNVDVTPRGDKAVVTYKGAQAVGIWDLTRGKELARVPTTRPVPHGVAVSDDGRFAFVSCESIGAQPGTVDVLDLRVGHRVASVAVGLQAGGIAFVGSRPLR